MEKQAKKQQERAKNRSETNKTPTQNEQNTDSERTKTPTQNEQKRRLRTNKNAAPKPRANSEPGAESEPRAKKEVCENPSKNIRVVL